MAIRIWRRAAGLALLSAGGFLAGAGIGDWPANLAAVGIALALTGGRRQRGSLRAKNGRVSERFSRLEKPPGVTPPTPAAVVGVAVDSTPSFDPPAS